MRILHLLNHTRRLNGHVHAAIDLACAQVSSGHSVAIASGGGDFDEFLAANGVETAIVNHQRRPATLLTSLVALYRKALEWRADVVHAHMMTSAVLAWPVSKLLRIPLITTVHNEFQRSSILMGLGTRVITVSAAVGESMQRRGVPKSRINTVLNGTIGSARFEGKDRTPRRLDSPAIIFVGGLHPRKGILDLFKAFAIVHSRYPEARLYVVGSGPHHDEYVDMANSMDCANAISFMGAQDDPFPFMLGADIFVLPSHADPAPLVLSEAREAGCAIVATDVDGIPELLEHGRAGILVPPRDPAGLAEALCSLIGDSIQLQVWKMSSQVNLDYLRIDRVANETLEVYASACREIDGSLPRALKKRIS
ncbi:glycosyltransferase [Microvirga sp. KLBC 81]|uniref:glycosyltransferase family 4 protein n=1 Tax=Microvirga sp. KLBC 81 TaxID=1862707 RepID=UPI000D52523E|nr:glycosyltransferase family 4 protein [Microvirga sp. KLBC 81]PVE21807.1 glycosyltransferase [Microvirga sp. KLBC 81]